MKPWDLRTSLQASVLPSADRDGPSKHRRLRHRKEIAHQTQRPGTGLTIFLRLSSSNMSRLVYTGDFCCGNLMQFLLRQSCNSKIARVNQVRSLVRFVAAISQGVSNMFETCCNFSATKISLSCCDKNRLCKQAFTQKGRLHKAQNLATINKNWYCRYLQWTVLRC